MLGHGAATGETHVYICVCDETWKYYEEIFLRVFLQDEYFPVCWDQCFRSYCCVRVLHVYGRGNKWIVYTLAACSMKYLLKLKMLQYCSLFN